MINLIFFINNCLLCPSLNPLPPPSPNEHWLSHLNNRHFFNDIPLTVWRLLSFPKSGNIIQTFEQENVCQIGCCDRKHYVYLQFIKTIYLLEWFRLIFIVSTVINSARIDDSDAFHSLSIRLDRTFEGRREKWMHSRLPRMVCGDTQSRHMLVGGACCVFCQFALYSHMENKL